MLLIYTPRITPRVEYTFNFILEKVLGIDFQLTTDKVKYNSSVGSKVQYAEKIDESSMFWRSSGLLFEKGVNQNYLPEPPTEIDPEKYDLFSLIFFLLSRYEEYGSYTPDEHGRYKSSSSILSKWNYLQKPIADQWIIQIGTWIKGKFPELTMSANQYAFQTTLDIDNAYAYRGKGFTRTLGGYLKALIKGNMKDVHLRYQVLNDKYADPFDTYSYQKNIHEKFNVQPIYFFLLGDWAPYDKNLQWNSKEMKSLISDLIQSARIGIHPSYTSNTETEQIKEQAKRLAKLTQKETTISRQHFLKLQLPNTYKNLIDAGILEDYTMGYADNTGFRAGTSRSFFWYDLNEEKVTGLLIHPFAVMDGTLNQYLNLDPQQAIERIKRLVKEVKAVNGNFICIWHNESLSEWREWKSWRMVYEELIKIAAPDS